MVYTCVDRDSLEQALAIIRSEISLQLYTTANLQTKYAPIKKMIIGGFDRTDSSSFRIYSNYHHHHHHHHHHHQSLHVLEIVPYLHGLPGSHVDL